MSFHFARRSERASERANELQVGDDDLLELGSPAPKAHYILQYRRLSWNRSILKERI